VPAKLLGGLEKDEPARGFIIEQDREIGPETGVNQGYPPRRREEQIT
jgi:hypothetical protein